MAGVAKRELSRKTLLPYALSCVYKTQFKADGSKVIGLCDGGNGLKDIYYQ